MMSYTVVVDDQGVRDALANLLEVLGDATPVMKSIAEDMRTDVTDHFRTQLGSDGGEWLPSKRAYAATYAKGNTLYYGQTLRKSGRLLNSIAQDPSAITATPSMALLQTPVIYAPVHNFGLTIPNRNGTTTMPKREFMWLSRAAINAIIQRMQDAVAAAWNR